ncbi:terminase large subunit [Aureimonas leprariae]|uniref:Terminase large subunit n=1 Tax=Plantimonas leprariae TaxID=2615207 RepID=A0A7V7TW29_9HYPH|nr:terminase TerL endonuclease subunit [Aureimonas leprariae]KAB0679528.1 terminase large subunit [Aureimonas leprariae]
MTSSAFPSWIHDKSEIADPFGYGERAVRFLRLLKHPKSSAPGRAFTLDPWQERIVRRIYGPRHPNGDRIVKTVVLLLPRGNRKSSLAAALALLHTIGPERVPGGEAIFAAGDRTQAGIGFREAANIVREDRRLTAATTIYDAHNSAKKIVLERDGTFLEIVSSDGKRQHGRTPGFVLADEIHIWQGGELYEALTTGLEKTDNGLLVIATTAGKGQENIAWRVIEDARKVARGEVDDASILPILFEADRDADWQDEALWHRVNPGLAHGYPSLDGMRRHAKRAERSPTERDSFRQLKLNIWLDNSTSPFVDMAVYDRGQAPIDLEALRGAPCWLGVDMSTTTDLTAVVAAFHDPDDPDGFLVLPHFFCPGDQLRARGERDGVPYPLWAEQGFLIPTPGEAIDYRAVEAKIRELAEIYDVREMNFDIAYSQPVTAPLLDDGFPVATMRQGWVTQSPALNVLERAIVAGKFRHGGHPVLKWCFGNVAIHTDSAGNRTMHKGKSTDRIDGAVATWMAVARAAANDTPTSIYSSAERSGDLTDLAFF